MANQLAPLPYYKWFWQRWRANRNVQRMSLADRGAYRELIDECWSEGFIPDDIAALADICGCEVEEMAEVWPRIKPRFYEMQPGRYANRALEDQRTELDALRVVNSKNAKDAASARLKAANAERTLGERWAIAGRTLGDRHIEEKRREEESIEEKSNRLRRSRSQLRHQVMRLLSDPRCWRNRKRARARAGRVRRLDPSTSQTSYRRRRGVSG